MDEIILSYGRKTLRFKSPPNLLGVIQPREGEAIDIVTTLTNILQNPIGSSPLNILIKKGDRIVIIIPDKTRRCPTKEILLPLLDEVERIGIKEISLIIANGAHEQHPVEELGLGEDILKRVKIFNHNARQKRDLVKIKIQREVWVNKIVASADLAILIGTISPHLMAGFSGGAKGIIPGVAGIKTIGLNHFLMLNPKARWGVIEGNILREDIEKSARFLKNVFILNAIYDRQKKVIGLVGGDMINAHREGVKLCREIGEVNAVRSKTIEESDMLRAGTSNIKQKRADIVIASDSYPETINVYQTIKLIAPAAMLVKPRGVIILAGECPEGEGELTLFNRLFYWRLLKKYLPKGVAIYLLSELKKTKNFPFFLKPISSIEEGIDRGFKKIGPEATIIILSGAGLLIPKR